MKKSIEIRVKRIKVLAIIVSISFLLGLIYTVKVTAFREKDQVKTVLGVTTKSTVIGTETVVQDVEVAGQNPYGYRAKNYFIYISEETGPTVTISFSSSFGVANVSVTPGKRGSVNGGGILIPDDGGYHKVYRRMRINLQHVKTEWYQDGKVINTVYSISGTQIAEGAHHVVKRVG